MSTIAWFGSTRPISLDHCRHAHSPQKSSTVDEPALQEVVAQAHDLELAEADGPDVRHEEEGTLVELVPARAHDRVARLSVRPVRGLRRRQLFEAYEEVMVRAGILGVPAVAERLAPYALIEQAAERKAPVDNPVTRRG